MTPISFPSHNVTLHGGPHARFVAWVLVQPGLAFAWVCLFRGESKCEPRAEFFYGLQRLPAHSRVLSLSADGELEMTIEKQRQGFRSLTIYLDQRFARN
jgi:hypothetical protein